MYNCKVIVNGDTLYDDNHTTLKTIAFNLGLPYSRVADIHTRPTIKKTKFIYEPKIIITKIEDNKNLTNNIDAEKGETNEC